MGETERGEWCTQVPVVRVVQERGLSGSEDQGINQIVKSYSGIRAVMAQ